MEQPAGEDARGTMGYVAALFEDSTDFAEKSEGTRRHSEYCAQVAREFKNDKGRGSTLDKLYVNGLTLPAIQAIIGSIAKGRKESAAGGGDAMPRPSIAANHLLRYFRVLFGWGMRHGHCKTNPAGGAKQVKERKRHGMPAPEALDAVLMFALARGSAAAHTKGSSSPYLWPLLEIKYL